MSTGERNGGTGTIHDQGYQRYQGMRLPQSRRFLVIARNVLTTAWKSRWGVKLPVLAAVITTVVAAGIMVAVGQIESRLGGPLGQLLRADAVLFYSTQFFGVWGLILAVTVATAAIADDLKSGAFQFYFSRPLRPSDYVRGKLLGLFALVGMATLAGPLVLSIIRLCLVDDVAEAVKLLAVIPRALLLGVAATLALVLPAAGLGALLTKRTPAQAAFIVYFVVFGTITEGLAHGLRTPYLALFSLRSDVLVIGRDLFGVYPEPYSPEPWQAGVAILVYALAGYLALRLRLRSAATAGLGGV